MLFSWSSPLAEVVQLEMWELKGPPLGRPLHCNQLRCASSHSWAEWGAPWRHGWPGWRCYGAALHVCEVQTESLFCCRCLQTCCARHQQSHSRSQYPLLDLWSWKGLLYCCVLERRGSHGCSTRTMDNTRRNREQMNRSKRWHPEQYEAGFLVSELLTYLQVSP